MRMATRYSGCCRCCFDTQFLLIIRANNTTSGAVFIIDMNPIIVRYPYSSFVEHSPGQRRDRSNVRPESVYLV
jgi:hypothetical protein